MTEAIFAGENIEKFAMPPAWQSAAAVPAKFAGLTQHFFLRHRPTHGRHRQGQNEQPYNLCSQRHTSLEAQFGVRACC
jgi:hypothetical protein